MYLFTALAVLSLLAITVQGQPCSGILVGNLPDLNHDVSGQFYIEDETSYCIENFFYDGGGPDAFLYLYYVGDSTFIKGRGVITPVPGQSMQRFEFGRRYSGERFRFQVPEGHRTCDYGGFGIWCRYASQLFTVLSGLEVHFSEDGSGDTIMCTPSPGRAFLGALDGTLISGDLFAVNSSQFAIRDLAIDPALNIEFYGIPVGMTPDIQTGVNLGTASPGALAMIDVPADSATCDFSTVSAYNTNVDQFVAEVSVDLSTSYSNNPLETDHTRSLVLCDRPTTRPGVHVGELPKNGQGVEGTFYVRDDKTFYVQLFSYSAGATDVYLYYYREGQPVENTGHGYRIGFSDSMEPLPSGGFLTAYKKITPFVIDLNRALDETDVNTCDVSWFTIYSVSEQTHFTRIEIPADIFTTDAADPGIADRTKVLCSETAAIPTPRTGGGAPPTTPLMGFTIFALIALLAMIM